MRQNETPSVANMAAVIKDDPGETAPMARASRCTEASLDLGTSLLPRLCSVLCLFAILYLSFSPWRWRLAGP